jgi:hypothetical protein
MPQVGERVDPRIVTIGTTVPVAPVNAVQVGASTPGAPQTLKIPEDLRTQCSAVSHAPRATGRRIRQHCHEENTGQGSCTLFPQGDPRWNGPAPSWHGFCASRPRCPIQPLGQSAVTEQTRWPAGPARIHHVVKHTWDTPPRTPALAGYVNAVIARSLWARAPSTVTIDCGHPLP